MAGTGGALRAGRVIDAHSHMVPASAVGPAERGELWHGIQFGRSARGKIVSSVGGLSQEIPWPVPFETLPLRLAAMDERRVEVHVVSISPTMYWYNLDPANAASYARATNDDLAAAVAAAPDRLAALAYLPFPDVPAAVAELERAVTRLGFAGAMVGTHVNGTDWDDPALWPVLEAAESLGAALYVHPSRVRAAPVLSRFHFSNTIGNPLETTIALGSLIFGGAFDRFPRLRTCFAHGGGFAVIDGGRFDRGHAVRPEARRLERRPSEYLRLCWFDCITHGERALRYLIDEVGADRVVLGSDHPADMGEPRPVDFIEGCALLTGAERDLILRRNAAAFLTGKGA